MTGKNSPASRSSPWRPTLPISLISVVLVFSTLGMSPAGATAPVIADESWQIAAADASATPTELRAEASDGSLTLSVVREYNGEPTFSSIEIGSQNELSSVLAELEKDASVISMEPEVMFRATSSATLSNSIVRTEAARVDLGTIESTNKGAGIITAVIDSGVDSRHVALASQVLNGVDYYDGVSTLTGGCTSFDAATYPRWQGDTNVKPNHAGFGKFDPEGHGTHVAGIIAANGFGMTGVAPESKILPVRVLGADGSGDSTDVACGITWAADNGADIINMSLGSDTDSMAVNVAVKHALSKGVVVLAAAGNDGPNNGSPSYPAATNTSTSTSPDSPPTYDVIAVGATNSAGDIQSFSNRGSYVDFAAPGVDILSTCMATPVFSANNVAINSCGTGDESDRYESLSGTSMATPHVAGIVALIMSANSGVYWRDVTQTLINIAVDKGEQGLDSAYGYGFINAPTATTRNLNYAISTLTSNAHFEELRLTDLANAEVARLAQIKRDAAAAARLASLPVVRASLSVKVLKKKRISISVAAPAGAKTTIQRKVGKKWRKISTRYTLPNSIIKLRKAGTYRVKIVLPTGTITTKSYKVK